MDSPPRVTSIAVMVNLDDGTCFTCRAAHPVDPVVAITPPFPDISVREIDLVSAPMIKPAEWPWARIEFKASPGHPIIVETSSVQPEQLVDAYRKVTGIPYDDVLRRAGEAEKATVPRMVGDWPWQYTQLSCPLGACRWTHIVGSPPGVLDGIADRDVVALMTRHAMVTERAVQDHMATHSASEWVREVTELRQRADQAERACRE